MKQSAVPANKNDHAVQFRLRDAQRIASVVHIVETERRGRKPSWLPRAFGGKGSAQAIRVCTFPGEWPKGTEKIVTLTYAGSGTNTAIATNILFNVAGSCDGEARKAIIGKDNGMWFLINAEC